MGERTWTPGQQDAIYARGGTLLVSAAAGSGKTAVLVQRVIERLTDPKNPSDADHLLIVTFTKAAAAEMKERISARLSELIAENPQNRGLKRQQVLLEHANISTVHSFCSELIRENFYKLQISPDFRIMEETEMAVLRKEALTFVIEENYEKADQDFYDLIEIFGSGRDDSRLMQTIETLYDFVRSHPFPAEWLSKKASLYRTENQISKTIWGQKILIFAREATDYAISLTTNSLQVMQQDEKLDKAYRPAFESDLAQLNHFRQILAQKDWDVIGQAAQKISFVRLGALRGYGENFLKIRLNSCRTQVKDTVKKIVSLFEETEEECRQDLKALAPVVEKLFAITLQFSDRIDQMKMERHGADFGDLEHLALRLLVRGNMEKWERTPEALELSKHFDEIMVDEYQDTNEAQDMIFRAVSQNENNLFFVGDVKQSIYSFRQAMPQLFLKRKDTSFPYCREKENYPATIVLDKNFRSRKTVTDAVNFVFGQLMSVQAGDIAYEGKELLVAGATYPEQDWCKTEFDIIDCSMAEEEDSMPALEGRKIAERIQNMVQQKYLVTEKGKTRPVEYRDFCVLLRSANQYAQEYVKELQANGVPAWADIAGGLFSCYEIAVMISLLRVINNPMQDIPLLSVLMSPIYGFTSENLAQIRLDSEEGSVYIALLKAAEKNQQISSFLKDMERYRTMAAILPADRLIADLYEETGYLKMAQAMPGGELRLSNLRLFLEHARRYENSGYHGLTGFIRLLDRIQEQKGQLEGASASLKSVNAVQVMSVHKSKGLEFPICILAGCSRKFNRERGDVLLHPELGLGVKIRNPVTSAKYTTLPREAIALEQDRNLMSEELRILYVAMTRAKEKLILLTTVANLDRTLGKLSAQISADEKIPPYIVRSGDSISSWILLCALRLPEGKWLRERACAQEDIVIASDDKDMWDISFSPPILKQEKSGQENLKEPITINPELFQTLQHKTTYIYPYQSLKGIPSKVSASELAGNEFEGDYALLSRPAFMEREKMTPSERGTALHAFMQFADYLAAAQNPQQELERLTQKGFLSPEQKNVVDLDRVQRFFQSQIGKRILQSSYVERERRFLVEIPAKQLSPQLTGESAKESVILQGAVDCMFEEKGELVIVDYKTDRMKNREDLWNRYRGQVDLYRIAIEQCTGKKVKECLLYSFYLNCEISGDFLDFEQQFS